MVTTPFVLNQLERRFGRFAIPNVVLFLVVGQLIAFLLAQSKPLFADALVLYGDRVLGHGEVWRIFSFVFVPPASHIVFALITLYFNYFLGQALEAAWGSFRLNVFLFVGWIAAVIAAFLFPYSGATGVGLSTSIFLAFAALNPDYEIRLYFLFPIKVKYLGYLALAASGYGLLTGTWGTRAQIIASLINVTLFFGRDVLLRARGISRTRRARVERIQEARTATHTCQTCGLTDLDDRNMQFRYCSKCSGTRAYCEEHLKTHEHVV